MRQDNSFRRRGLSCAQNLAWAVVVFGIGFACATLVGRVLEETQSLTAVPTFSKDVAPILFRSCVSCHRPGGTAPMSLMTYEEARLSASAIRKKFGEGSMSVRVEDAPPGAFEADHGVGQADRDTLIAWASNGAPLGDPTDLPHVSPFTNTDGEATTAMVEH